MSLSFAIVAGSPQLGRSSDIDLERMDRKHCFLARLHYSCVFTKLLHINGRCLVLVSQSLPSKESICHNICHPWVVINLKHNLIPNTILKMVMCLEKDRLCGLMVRVPGYRSRGLEFDSRRYQIFCEVVGPKRGSLSPVSKIEEPLGRNNSASGLENGEYGRGDPLR
jgi:hypothetical protein